MRRHGSYPFLDRGGAGQFEGQIFKESRDGGRVRNMENLRARLLALTIVDVDNKRIFQDEDIAALGGKNAAVLDRLFEVSQRLSGIRRADTRTQ